MSKISLSYELSYSRLDRALIVPPLGWAHLAAYVPRNPSLITVLYVLFVAFGALAIVGLCGRLACCVTSAVGFYLLTLPQLFGKINHDHNLVLFGFILAASPCCDTFSVDAIRDALRAARHGQFLTCLLYTSTPSWCGTKTISNLMMRGARRNVTFSFDY